MQEPFQLQPVPLHTFFATQAALWLVIPLFMHTFLPQESDKKNAKNGRQKAAKGQDNFSLYLGTSTGELVKRNHKAGMGAAQKVCLTDKDAALNILILGGIGEGKTTRVINSLLLQLLDQDCGGLIFDVKGSFHKAVTEFSALTAKEIVTIGPGKQRMNLIEGLKPEVAADIMSSIFLMFNGHDGGAFWNTQATNLCRGALGLLSFSPENYTLAGLRSYIFDPDFKENIDKEVSFLVLEEYEAAMLESYRQSIAMFDGCADRMKDDIRATASSALSQFTHPAIKESFCSHGREKLTLEEVLNGKIFLVDMPKAEYGKISRTIHTVIKMRWFQVMEARRRHEEWNQDRMVFFMCDEYQDLVTADATGGSISDLSFWDKARDTKSIGIISSQSISSFYSAIGNRDLADTVLQNFRQRICFKTEDEKTLLHIQRLTGEVMVAHKSSSENRGKSYGGNISLRKHTSRSTTENLTEIRQHVIDWQLMRVLEPNQVVALLNLGQRSMDDVLNLQPVFLREKN